MKIAVDAMGGDHAPDEIVRGALLYRRQGGASDLVLVGREEAIRKLVGAEVPPGITIRDAKDVVGMDEHPATALRRRGDTSIGVATAIVKHGEADAVVSAGNTGATMAAALLVLGRIRGIDRPALCGMLPTTKGKPACLLDAGATMDADEHNILQFARMATRFMEKIHGVDRPSVGLINVGEEPEKGGRMQLAAHALLEGAEDLNFYGNILAKGMEGVVDVFVEGIRRDIFGGPLGKVAGLIALGGISKFRSRMDYDPYVSAPLLGVAGISVVTHGRARANMMRRAIEVAERAVSTRLLDALGEGVASAA